MDKAVNPVESSKTAMIAVFFILKNNDFSTEIYLQMLKELVGST